MRSFALLSSLLVAVLALPAAAQSDADSDRIVEAIGRGDANALQSMLEAGMLKQEDGLDYAHVAVDAGQFGIASYLIEALDIDVTQPIDPDNLNQSFMFSLSGKAADAYFVHRKEAALVFLDDFMTARGETARLFYFLSSSGCSAQFDALLNLAERTCLADRARCTYPAHAEHAASGLLVIDASRAGTHSEFLEYLDWRADYYPGACVSTLKEAVTALQ